MNLWKSKIIKFRKIDNINTAKEKFFTNRRTFFINYLQQKLDQ